MQGQQGDMEVSPNHEPPDVTKTHRDRWESFRLNLFCVITRDTGGKVVHVCARVYVYVCVCVCVLTTVMPVKQWSSSLLFCFLCFLLFVNRKQIFLCDSPFICPSLSVPWSRFVPLPTFSPTVSTYSISRK